MATTRSFQDMLNEYLPNDLLKEELIKRDYLLTKVEKDNNWLGGTLIVPFKAAGASSVAFGSLSASNDIAEDKYVRGEVSGHKEVWGSMIFNHRDLMEHESISEQNFLKILPGAIEDFMDYLKNVVSVNLLNGAHFAKLTADATANDGLIVVDRPDRFVIGQKVIVDDDDSAAQTAYVSTINMNSRTILLVTARGGATPFDFSAVPMTVAQNAKCYNDGAQTSSNVFSSLRGALLSAANGGDATLYGQTKTSYPYLQAINVDGASITASNIMQKIFDALTTVRQLGKGNPSDIVMSYKNLGACIKVIESSKGAFNVTPGSQKASQYGWTELEVGSVAKGALKIVGVQECDDDVIFLIDWRALKFYSNGFFKRRMSPDGKEYFEIRNTSGYQYIVDMCLFGEFVVLRPSYCGVIHGVSF
jgi:hypothetical protein